MARNAVFRPQGPAVARMGFFNWLSGGVIRVRFGVYVFE